MKYTFMCMLVILLSGCFNNSKNIELETQIEDLIAERDSLVRLNSQLESKLDSLVSDFWFANSTEGKQLHDAGIKNPKEYIITSLKQQPELVPAEPVLGGQMRFTRVLLLSRDCLIAYYEDGHVAGRAIYSFSFQNGNLKFSLVRKCNG